MTSGILPGMYQVDCYLWFSIDDIFEAMKMSADDTKISGLLELSEDWLAFQEKIHNLLKYLHTR